MTPPKNNDLRGANRALQSTVQGYKTIMDDMRRIIDDLTATGFANTRGPQLLPLQIQTWQQHKDSM